jgi:hypothetical protein
MKLVLVITYLMSRYLRSKRRYKEPTKTLHFGLHSTIAHVHSYTLLVNYKYCNSKLGCYKGCEYLYSFREVIKTSIRISAVGVKLSSPGRSNVIKPRNQFYYLF